MNFVPFWVNSIFKWHLECINDDDGDDDSDDDDGDGDDDNDVDVCCLHTKVLYILSFSSFFYTV